MAEDAVVVGDPWMYHGDEHSGVLCACERRVDELDYLLNRSDKPHARDPKRRRYIELLKQRYQADVATLKGNGLVHVDTGTLPPFVPTIPSLEELVLAATLNGYDPLAWVQPDRPRSELWP
jgi:hypothetical protein